jgi:hypothetical protein
LQAVEAAAVLMFQVALVAAAVQVVIEQHQDLQ